jgi:hypothetical protein
MILTSWFPIPERKATGASISKSYSECRSLRLWRKPAQPPPLPFEKTRNKEFTSVVPVSTYHRYGGTILCRVDVSILEEVEDVDDAAEETRATTLAGLLCETNVKRSDHSHKVWRKHLLRRGKRGKKSFYDAGFHGILRKRSMF